MQLKTVYDQYGEEVLREGLKDQEGNYKNGYKYQENCYEIFQKFFLKHNPFYNIIDEQGIELYGSMFGSAFQGKNAPPFPA